MKLTKSYISAIEDAIGKPGRILPSCLNGYQPEEGEYTLYRQSTGRFCVVFPITCEGKAQKCIRLWHDEFDKGPVVKLADTLKELHKHADFIIGFEYFEQGLRLDDSEVIPAIVMDWIDGCTLSTYIKNNKGNPDAISRLATRFYDMCAVMNREGLAHGDLSTENIMVRPNGKLVLIDYDSFYAPTMGAQVKQCISGTPGFQHRQRMQQGFTSSSTDYFSQQVIYLGLLAIGRDRSLVDEEKHLVGETKLFFDEQDFEDESKFLSSNGYKAISSINDKDVQNRLSELRKAVKGSLSDVKSIVEYDANNGSHQQPKTQNELIAEKIRKARDRYRDEVKDAPVSEHRGTPQALGTSRTTSVNKRPVSIPKAPNPSAKDTAPHKKWYPWVGAAVIAVGLYFVIGNKGNVQAEENAPMATEVVSVAAINHVEGNYTLREKVDGTLVNGMRTCAIKLTSASHGSILVTSEYDPQIFEFSIDASGRVDSEHLGSGEIIYNEKLNKTIITFKQGNRVCEFVK